MILLGKNRDRLSIVASILEAANPKSSKTHIMFNANLSYNLLEKYLDIIDKAGFIRFEDSKYMLTEQGREFLKKYKRFEDRYLRAQKIFDTLLFEREELTRLCGVAKVFQKDE